jgi:hypothetical protein
MNMVTVTPPADRIISFAPQSPAPGKHETFPVAVFGDQRIS